MKSSLCIYCGAPFDPYAGQGDHFINAALGEFASLKPFRGACHECNVHIGRSEEQLVRCGPESDGVRLSDPRRRRGRERPSEVGAHGVRPPLRLVQREGVWLLARLVPGYPGGVEVLDQLVVVDQDRRNYQVLLFPEMSPESLRAQILALQADHPFGDSL